MEIKFEEGTPLLIDNQGALDLIKSGHINNRTKHIDTKFRHICDREEGRDIMAEHVCHKLLLSPSILSLFFSFSLLYFTIYSVGNSVTPCDIIRDKVTSKVTSRSHVTSQDMSHIVWLGVQNN